MKKLDKQQLQILYVQDLKSPGEIAKILGCDHKTVRKYLRLYSLPLRAAAEYNYLPRASHTSPSGELLTSRRSIAAHAAYLCEGWHTEKTTRLSFCNTDPLLVDLMVDCLLNVYRVKKLSFKICAATREEADSLLSKYPSAQFYVDPLRKTPIVRLDAGGRTLASEFIANCYRLISP